MRRGTLMKINSFFMRPKNGDAPSSPIGAKPERDAPGRYALDLPKVGLLVFTIAALSLLMSARFWPDRVSLRLGDVSSRDIHAARSVTYINNAQTDRLREARALNVAPIYDTDTQAASAATQTVRDTFDHLEAARAAKKPANHSQLQYAAQFAPQFSAVLTVPQIARLLSLPLNQFQQIRATSFSLTADAMKGAIRDRNDDLRPARDLRYIRKDIDEAANDALSNDQDAAIAAAAARQAVRPNSLLNVAKTQAAQDVARRGVPPALDRIAMGDPIVHAGETVTQDHLDKFHALGLLDPRAELTAVFAVCALAASMALLVVFAIRRTLPKLYADTRRLTLLSVIVLLSVFGLKMGATMLGLQFSGGQLGYLGMMSVAAAGMLVCVLLDTHLAVLIIALLAALSGLIMNHEVRFTVMTLMSSLVGIACVTSKRRKVNLLGTLTALAAANVGLVLLLGLLLGDTMRELLTGAAWGAASAAFATFLFWFGVLALEKPFGILTHATLLELSAFDRPVLQQLCATAPGTYAHSMMVGTLAEAGATAINANALLARVGGYYHDIGKMKRPDFFVENQRRENVHGRLSPSLSALIITAHVRDGLEMAKEQRLPDEIRDIIAQHHGTTLIRYFYHQALADCNGPEGIPPGLEASFRYPGPKPQGRESAIVMLADSIEAAARCLDSPTQERLQAQIDTIVRDKIEDGQLDECRLTFLDVKRIADAFLHVLLAMNHGRINYPAPVANATGRPMEVSRPDLQPSALPVSPEETLLEGMPIGSAETPLLMSGIKPLMNSIEGEPELLDDSSIRAVVGENPPGSPFPLNLLEPETLYARHLIEHADSSGQDDGAAAGHASPAAKRRPRPRRS